MVGGTVMVVEDDASIREMVMQLLAGEGFTPVGALNGEDALHHLRRDRVHPSLILLDLMMPVMNGRQFRAEQLKDPSLARIPVVIMSASDEGDVPAEARVGKPFDIAVLLGVVSRFAQPGTLH